MPALLENLSSFGEIFESCGATSSGFPLGLQTYKPVSDLDSGVGGKKEDFLKLSVFSDISLAKTLSATYF